VLLPRTRWGAHGAPPDSLAEFKKSYFKEKGRGKQRRKKGRKIKKSEGQRRREKKREKGTRKK